MSQLEHISVLSSDVVILRSEELMQRVKVQYKGEIDIWRAKFEEGQVRSLPTISQLTPSPVPAGSAQDRACQPQG